jgi:HK97 family phage prohead protease
VNRLSPSFEFKAAVGGEPGTFTGLASVFGPPADAVGDIIAPGAFSASLRAHKARGTAPALLWAHDIGEPIGAWKSIKETAEGLEVAGRLSLGVPRADDAYRLLKDGGLTGLSIGYTLPNGPPRCDARGCLLEQIELHEVSLVSVPAHPLARIRDVKSASCECGDLRSVSELTKFFQAEPFGYSRATAREAALYHMNLQGLDDEPSLDDVRALTDQIRHLDELFTKGMS